MIKMSSIFNHKRVDWNPIFNDLFSKIKSQKGNVPLFHENKSFPQVVKLPRSNFLLTHSVLQKKIAYLLIILYFVLQTPFWLKEVQVDKEHWIQPKIDEEKGMATYNEIKLSRTLQVEVCTFQKQIYHKLCINIVNFLCFKNIYQILKWVEGKTNVKVRLRTKLP